MKRILLALFLFFSCFVLISCSFSDSPGSDPPNSDSYENYNVYEVTRVPTETSRDYYSGEIQNQFIIEDDILQASGYLRAVSVSNLQQKLKDCQDGDCPTSLLELGELTSLFGFVIDDSGDLLLLGHANPSLPPILTEDFIVALRNVWYLYSEVIDNIIYYSFPAVSIEPDDQVMADLANVVDRLFDSEQKEAAFQQWENICSANQEVLVFGIPFQSNFAQVLVYADYYLKDIVNGNNPLGISDFSSLLEMQEQSCLEELEDNGSCSPFFTNNRFWFYPGENSYVTDEGIVLLQDCPIELLTELLEGDADPLATSFADTFTARYQEIAAEEPIYRQQENLFRLFAIAKILTYERDTSGTMPDLDYFLYDYPVPETGVPSYLPGRSAIREINYEREEPDGALYTVEGYLPSCGGVDLRIDPIETDFHSSKSLDLAVLSEAAGQNKLEGEAFYDINLGSKGIVFTVNYDFERLGELADRIASQLDETMAICYLCLNEFPNSVAKNEFIQAVKTRQAAIGSETALRPWNEDIEKQATIKFLGSPVTVVKQEPEIENEPDSDGLYGLTTIFSLSDGRELKVQLKGSSRAVLEKVCSEFPSAIDGLVNPTSDAILNAALKVLTPSERETLDVFAILDSSTKRLI